MKIQQDFYADIWILILSFCLVSSFACKKKERIAKISTDAAEFVSDSAFMKFTGTILEIGDNALTDHGFCWNTGGNPTFNDSRLSNGAVSNPGVYSGHVSNLTGNVQYHVRAYASDGEQLFYGSDLSFQMPLFLKLLPAVQNIGATAGNAQLFLKSNISWTASSDQIWLQIVPTAGNGEDTLTVSVIENPAFASRTANVTAFGAGNSTTAIVTQSGATPVLATISNAYPTEIVTTTAKAEGNITDLGNSAVTQHGHCWSTSPDPTINDNKTQLGSAISTGTFTSSLTGLNAGTTYYLKAYATNYAGTAYGNQIVFSTLSFTFTQVITGSPSNITFTTASITGKIIDLGNSDVTQHGHCWATTSNPTTSNIKTTLGYASDTGTFTSSLSGLTVGTNYYIRAYATNSAGTTYGNQIVFSTLSYTLAQVTTGDVSNITMTSAMVDGDITDLGNTTVTQHGHCWSTNPNPTTNNSKTTLGQAIATGPYSSTLNELMPDSIYYFKAYATNDAGTSYGEQKTVHTLPSPVPTVYCNGYLLYVHPTDNSIGMEWGGEGTFVNALSNTEGEQNTDSIVLKLGNNGGDPYAAKLCKDLVAFGFDDWYLPSAFELNCLYENRTTIGNFTQEGYWSSTEYNANYAWYEYFHSTYGSIDYAYKDSNYNVRCVRNDKKKK